MSDVRNNESKNRYELSVEGHVAVAEYQQSGGTIVFTHTIVPSALEGRGIGSRLIAGALADVRARGWKLVARCPFVARYMERHPETQDLRAPG